MSGFSTTAFRQHSKFKYSSQGGFQVVEEGGDCLADTPTTVTTSRTRWIRDPLALDSAVGTVERYVPVIHLPHHLKHTTAKEAIPSCMV